jgi:hypothetical protein
MARGMTNIDTPSTNANIDLMLTHLIICFSYGVIVIKHPGELGVALMQTLLLLPVTGPTVTPPTPHAPAASQAAIKDAKDSKNADEGNARPCVVCIS